MIAHKRMGVVIVSHGHDKILRQLLLSLSTQKISGDILVVVDNHPNKKGASVARKTGLADKVITTQNKGFSAGCNLGAKAVENDVDILFFLNPDTLPGDNALDVIRQKQNKYALVMPLLLLPNGRVNSAGNIVHISGLSWCEGLEHDQSLYSKDTKIHVASGACLAVSSEWWKKLGGMEENYFMYYEDTDFSTRALLLGAQIGLLPEARVEHDYEYNKGQYKWFYLERNRLIYIIRCWPIGVIIVLLPLLLAVEISLWLVAILQKRFLLKLKSTASMVKVLPFAFRSRATIQKTKTMSSLEFYHTLASNIDSPVIGPIGRNTFTNTMLGAYYRVAESILKIL